jgi:hypothetical protein
MVERLSAILVDAPTWMLQQADWGNTLLFWWNSQEDLIGSMISRIGIRQDGDNGTDLTLMLSYGGQQP